MSVILSLRRIRDSDANHGKRILRSYLPQDDMQLITGSKKCVPPYERVIYDDGWTRVYAPCPATDWFAEVEYLRIPWVEEAKSQEGCRRRAATVGGGSSL